MEIGCLLRFREGKRVAYVIEEGGDVIAVSTGVVS